MREEGVKELKMVFYVKNESKIRLFYLNDKMDNACVSTKNRLNAFLVAEKMNSERHPPKNA